MTYPKAKLITENQNNNEEICIQEKELHEVTLGEAGSGKINDVEPRIWGEFARKAFFLNQSYDWILAYDSEGKLLLIPRKRQ